MVSKGVTRLLALWGIVASLALGVLVARQSVSEKNASVPCDETRDAALERTGTQAREDAPSMPAAAAPPTAPGQPLSLQRYGLCTATALPSLHPITLEERPLLSVHCGGEARVIDLLRAAPTPLFDVTIKPVQPGTTAQPSTFTVTDLQQDGHADLVLGTRFMTAQGSAAGGGIYVMRRDPRGTYDAPRRLLSAHPLSLSPLPNTQVPLLVVHGADASRGQRTALWTFDMKDGGTREALGQAPEGARELLAVTRQATATVLLWNGSQEGRAGVFVQRLESNADTPPASHFVDAGQVTAASTGDVDGDGQAEFVLAGSALHWLSVSSGESSALHAVPDSDCPPATEGENLCHRDPHSLDVDGDGRPELVSYVHPALHIYRATGDDGYERTTIPFEGDHVAVVTTRVLPRPGGAPMLVALTQPAGKPESLELALLPRLPTDAEVLTFSGTVLSMPHALLSTHDAL